MKDFKQKLDLNFGYNVNPELSMFKLLLIKINILLIFLNKMISELNVQNYFAYSVRKLRNKGSGKSCIVLGNGPSLIRNHDLISKILVTENTEIIAVNQYPLTKLGGIWKPNYLVLSDGDSNPEMNKDFTIKLWEWIRHNPDTTVIVPSEWHEGVSKKLSLNESGHILYFCNLSLYGFTSNINLTLPKGYISLTAYIGIALANYLDFSRIYISGMDSNQFKTLNVNHENMIYHSPQYFDDNAKSEDVNLNGLYKQGVGGFLYGSSASILSLRKCFSKLNITNLDPDSMIDVFPKLRDID